MLTFPPASTARSRATTSTWMPEESQKRSAAASTTIVVAPLARTRSSASAREGAVCTSSSPSRRTRVWSSFSETSI